MTRSNRDVALGAGVLMIVATVAPAAAQVRTVTIDEAVELALRAQPAVIQARGNVRSAEADRREYLGDWLPTITGTSGWSTNSNQRFDQTTQRTVSGGSTSLSAGFNASYQVFDGFRRSATGRSTNANIESAHAALVNQRFQVALDTKQAFFTALAADELVRVADTRIQSAIEQLNIAREKLTAGSATRSDTLRSFVEFGNARLQRLNAETQRATATADLARLIGYDGGPLRVVPDPSLEVLSELDTLELRREALVNAPALEQAEADARAADAQVTVSRAQYFPSLSATYQQSWAGDAVTNLRNSWSARLSLSWPLFNGFTREAAVSRSQASQDVAYAAAEDARRQINAQVTQQFAALESARVRLEIATASHAAATEDLRVQRERYRLGVATIVEVLASQGDLDQAAVDMVQARLDYFLAEAELEALVGREI